LFADTVTTIRAASQPSDRKVLYYRDPSGAPYWSAEPKKDANGRDYLPVYDDEEPAFGPWAREKFGGDSLAAVKICDYPDTCHLHKEPSIASR
jgi:hypothetical protein